MIHGRVFGFQQHATTYFAWAEGTAGVDLPQFVKDEFYAVLLEGNILAHGFCTCVAVTPAPNRADNPR